MSLIHYRFQLLATFVAALLIGRLSFADEPANAKLLDNPFRVEISDERLGQTLIAVRTYNPEVIAKVGKWIRKNTTLPNDPPWRFKKARLPCLKIEIWRTRQDKAPFQIVFYEELQDDRGPWSVPNAEIENLMKMLLTENKPER